ncbi:MAG: efflux RND transporter permease subunit [Marinifilaceae bacterium]
MNLSEYALKNKALAYFLVFVLVIGGVFAFLVMSKLEDPAITVKQAMIVTTYPGASAYEVELEVTDLLEKSIRTMGTLGHVESRSMDDVSEILVELQSTVPPEKLQENWDILRRKVANVQEMLPSGCRPSVVYDDFGDVYGIFYAMTSEGFTYQQMSDYANLIRREMLDIEGVSRVTVWGNHPNAIDIAILEDKMANLGVHPAEVLITLQGQNKIVYSGFFNSGDKRIKVGVKGRFDTPEDIGELLIKGHENDEIKLKDIAIISMSPQLPIRESFYYNMTPALGISIAVDDNQNILTLGKTVDNKLEELKQSVIPKGLSFYKVFDQPQRVKTSIMQFMVNLVESVIIVVVIIMIFMGFRSGLTIGIDLAIIVLGSFLVLYLMHGTLQRVSLGSFIIAMGMLVDNAIVIVDGIIVDMKRGIKQPDCLVNIGRKTAWPLLGATTIGILAFYPIYLSPDTTGEYVRDLFIVLAVSLWLSWILALAYTPIRAKRMIKLKAPKEGSIAAAPFSGKSYDTFRSFLHFAIKNRFIVLIIAVGLLCLSGWGFKFISQGFFPDLSYNQLYIEYKMPYGANPDYVEEELSEISKYLMEQDGITSVATSFGGTPSRYNLVRTMAEQSLSYGELIVNFESPSTLKEMIPDLQDYLSSHHPQAYIRIKRYNLMYMNYPVQFQISGPDPDTLRYLCAQVENIMREDSNVMLVTNNWGPETPGFMVDYNQANARRVNLSREDVSMALLSSTYGLPMGTFYDGYHALPITLKCVMHDGQPMKQLNNVPVWSKVPNLNGLSLHNAQLLMQGAISKQDILNSAIGSIPLGQVAEHINVVWETPVVRRYNGQRTIAVQCNNAYGVSATDARNSLLSKIENLRIPPGYTTEWEGEFKASNESKKYLFNYIPLAMILIFTILLLLFKDFKRPVMVLACLPFAFIGITAGMLLANKQFGFVAIVGALGLIGMICKNVIVLIDEIDLQIRNGVPAYTAVIEGSTTRLRPVFLAAITTILGMLPLVGDDMFGSLSVTIMGGLAVGTLVTLILLPIFYSLFLRINPNNNE